KGGIRMQFSTWSFPKLAFALGVAGLLIGAGFSYVLPSQYTSKATLQIVAAQISSSNMSQSTLHNPLNELVQQLATGLLSRTRLIPIIHEFGLYSNSDSDDAVERMKNDIHITFVAAPGNLKGAAAFDVEFTYPDRATAQRTTAALVNTLMELNQL